MDTTRFDVIAIIFTILALLGLPRLVRGWRALVDPEPSAEGEALAVYVAMFIAVPLATLAHELGHLGTARLLGAGDATLHYRIFWGYVEHRGLPGYGNWWVALAGNAASWALAAAGLRLSSTRLPPGLQSAARTFGLLEMIHTLVVYPLLSLGSLPGADWTVIYGRPLWAGTWVVAAAHATSLLWLRNYLRATAPEPAPPETQPPAAQAGEPEPARPGE